MNTTADTYPATITIPEGYEARVSAQTASRDYSGIVEPGTYPVEYVSVQGHPVREGDRPYYARVRVPLNVAERTQSSVEYFGRALATETIPAHTEDHVLSWYAYEVRGLPDGATF